MDFKKIILYLALALVGVALWNAWQKDYPPQPLRQTQMAATQKASNSNQYTPGSYQPGSVPAAVQKSRVARASIAARGVSHSGAVVNVKTDVLDVAISLKGGNVVGARLIKYPISVQEKGTPMTILSGTSEHYYVAQSGVTSLSNNGRQAPIRFSASRSRYVMQPGQHTLRVVLRGRAADGVTVTKTFTFKRDHYVVDANTAVKNTSGRAWKGSFYNQIVRREGASKHAFHVHAYSGAAISSPHDLYEKISYKKMGKENVSRDIRGGWIAMQQLYFLSAWVPPTEQNYHYYSHMYQPNNSDGKHNIYTIGYVSPSVHLAPGGSKNVSMKLYVGPELGPRLKAVAKGLELTIDYGWLKVFSQAIFWLMMKIYMLVGNWGWSIVIVTLLIKLAFYKLSDKSFRSMARMKDLQPRLKALKERLGDDKQAYSKATMKLYKEEKVNPMGGCLPIIIQIPVFFALYYVLIETVQLRQAPFIFWIHDLSMKDPYYILPILMGISMFLTQRLNPPPPDPTQAKVMMFLPVIFTVFFLSFPAGLVLYWLVNNCAQGLQQWYITKQVANEKKGSKNSKKKK